MPRAHGASILWQRLPEEGEVPVARLDGHLGLGARGFFPRADCEAWVAGVYAAREAWTADFGGEQFSLGRAFYTHLEQGRSRDYFAGAAASDALVARHLPGMADRMRDLVAHLVGGTVRARRGWCGPGVHVFPAGEEVARLGGVAHFDTEGLSEHHVARRWPAITVVAMLQPPEEGGGLALWDVLYDGRDRARDEELAARRVNATYGAGDVVVLDSYRLHQIQPFGGGRDRISITVHAARVDAGWWETWF